jgi:hypothetical protein
MDQLSNKAVDSDQPFEVAARVPCLTVLFPEENKCAVFPYIHMLAPRQRPNEILIPFSVGDVQIRYTASTSDWVEEIMQGLAECTLVKLRHNKVNFALTVRIIDGEDLIPF